MKYLVVIAAILFLSLSFHESQGAERRFRMRSSFSMCPNGVCSAPQSAESAVCADGSCQTAQVQTVTSPDGTLMDCSNGQCRPRLFQSGRFRLFRR